MRAFFDSGAAFLTLGVLLIAVGILALVRETGAGPVLMGAGVVWLVIGAVLRGRRRARPS